MKKLLLTTVFIAVCSIFSNAQTNDLSYKELLAQQKIERQELKDMQKEFLKEFLIRQKEELDTLESQYDKGFKIKDNVEERNKINERFTQEREKQMQIQADERKLFIRPVRL